MDMGRIAQLLGTWTASKQSVVALVRDRDARSGSRVRVEEASGSKVKEWHRWNPGSWCEAGAHMLELARGTASLQPKAFLWFQPDSNVAGCEWLRI